MSFHLWIDASSRTVCRVFGSCRTSGATFSADQCPAADGSLSWIICPISRLSATWNFSQDSAFTQHSALLGCGLRRAEIVGPRIEDVQLREDHWVIEAASPQWGE
jgi:hypothetical protein